MPDRHPLEMIDDERPGERHGEAVLLLLMGSERVIGRTTDGEQPAPEQGCRKTTATDGRRAGEPSKHP
jgi:hypothetical protein